MKMKWGMKVNRIKRVEILLILLEAVAHIWKMMCHIFLLAVLARSASAFSGQLAELERALAVDSPSSSTPDPAGPMVSVESLRAYLQIVDVASILRLDRDIADHAFELFKECSTATCLRNRSVEALATAALVQAIREAREPRTLQVCVALMLATCLLKCPVQM